MITVLIWLYQIGEWEANHMAILIAALLATGTLSGAGIGWWARGRWDAAGELVDDLAALSDDDERWVAELHAMNASGPVAGAVERAVEDAGPEVTTVFPTHIFPAVPEPTRMAGPDTLVRGLYAIANARASVEWPS